MSGYGSMLASMGGSLFNHMLNTDMMNQVSTYNSPAYTMERMRAAGINPNAAAAGISGSPAYGSVNPVQVPDLGQSLNRGLMTQIENKVADAQVENIKADTDYIKSKTTGQNIENEWSPQQYEASVKNIIADTEKKTADSSYVKEQTRQLIELFPTQKDLMEFQAEKVRQDIINLRKQLEVMDQEMRESESRVGVNYASANRLNKQAAIDEFILSHGYSPDDPNGRMIMMSVSDDPDERKQADDLLDSTVALQDRIDEEKRNNDPIVQEQKKIQDYYNPKIDTVEREMKKMEDAHNGFRKARNRLGASYQKYLDKKRERDALIKKRDKELRRLGSGSSASVKVGPISASGSN